MRLDALWNSLDERLLPVLQNYRERLPDLQVSEKVDRTLLTEADLAVQKLIVETIEICFPGSGFVAEEDSALPRTGSPVWVIDPIDGTSQFVDPAAREFCSVVCRLESGVPTGGYVLAPELASGAAPVSIHWSEQITVNGQVAEPLRRVGTPRSASVTRSKNSPARPYERQMSRVDCRMKLRTTSQTLDMVRTCIDLSDWTDAPRDQFDLFYRKEQKVWDGIAGIGLAKALGKMAVNGSGLDPLPLGVDFLGQLEPTFPDTLVGDVDAVRWFIGLSEAEGS